MTATALKRDNLRGALRRESVKKNVAAIHVSGKLTLLQRKLVNVLLLNAYDGLISRRTHTIDARTLSIMIGYNSNDVDTLKEALRALVETTAEWDMFNDDGGREWGVSALLASARLRGGVCEYAYSPALAEKLHDPKIFSLINLSIQCEFSSGHALALYENCYRFMRTGSTGWWEIEVFRRLMGVHDSAYYQVFKHLNAKIIKPSVAEVNTVSNITITPEFRRQGRSVSHVRFLIRDMSQGSLVEYGAEADDLTVTLREKLRTLGVSDRLARQWLDEHGSAYVAEKLEYVAAATRKGRVQGSAVGYLSVALRDDWRARETAGELAAPAPSARTDTDSARVERARFELNALRRTHRAACFDAVEALAASRSPTQRDADRRQFLSGVRDDVDREDFRLRGWRSSVNAAAIFAFWEQIATETLPKLEAIAEDRGVDLAALRALAGE